MTLTSIENLTISTNNKENKTAAVEKTKKHIDDEKKDVEVEPLLKVSYIFVNYFNFAMRF